MTVASWWPLVAAGAGIAATIAWHLLSIARPPVVALPTARFLPRVPRPAVSRAPTPRDRLLLLARLLALAALGAAFAGVAPSRDAVRAPRLLVVDRAAPAGDTAAWRRALRARVADSAAWRTRALLVVDSLVQPVAELPDDRALATFADTVAPYGGDGMLPAAFLAAFRLEPALARRAAVREGRDTTPPVLDVVSVLSPGPLDVTWPLLRGAWRGAVRLAPVSEGDAGRETVAAPSPEVASAEATEAAPSGALRPVVTLVPAAGDDGTDDVVWSAVPAAWRAPGDASATSAGDAPRHWPVRIVRTPMLGAADSAAARDGAVVLHWPDVRDAGPERVDALVGSGAVLVGAYRRAAVPAGRALAWWTDGTPAVTEAALGTGCVRVVGGAPPDGDALLGREARTLLTTLVRPCAGSDADALARAADRARAGQAEARTTVAAFVRASSSRDASTRVADGVRADATRLAPRSPWLLPALVVAAAALLAELLLRRPAGRPRDTDAPTDVARDDVAGARA